MFRKLVLASAIAAASSAAVAMQAMDDETLSTTTGQDGLTISLNTNIKTNITYVDNNGTSVIPFTTDGAVLINNIGLQASGLTLTVDAGGNGTTGLLAIGVSHADAIVVSLSGTTIQVGDGAGVVSAATAVSGVLGKKTIVSFATGANLTVAGSGKLLDIQLGTEVTDFVTLNGDLGTVTLTGMSIIDADGNGGAGSPISVASLALSGLNLVNATVNVENQGLVFNTGTAGASLNNVGVAVTGLSFGATPAIGDVYLSSLDLSNNTITVAGH